MEYFEEFCGIFLKLLIVIIVTAAVCLRFCFVQDELFLLDGWGTLWKQYFISSVCRGTVATEKLQGFFFVAGHKSFCSTSCH